MNTQQPMPQMPPLPQRPQVPPLHTESPKEQIDEFLPTYSMNAYLPSQTVLTRALGLFDE